MRPAGGPAAGGRAMSSRSGWFARWPRRAPRPRVRVADEEGVRRLYIGTDTVQSAMRLSDPDALELAYTRAMLAPLLFRPEPRRVVLVGLGGGSLAKFVLRALPQCRLVAVEPDGEVIDAAHRHFHLPTDDPRLRVRQEDGVAHVAACAPGSVDLLLVDAFDGHAQVEACAGAGFLRAADAALSAEGACAFNLWNHAASYPAYRDRFLDVFRARAVLLPASRPGNLVAIGLARAGGDWRWSTLQARARALRARHGLEFPSFVDGLRAANPYTAERLLL